MAKVTITLEDTEDGKVNLNCDCDPPIDEKSTEPMGGALLLADEIFVTLYEKYKVPNREDNNKDSNTECCGGKCDAKGISDADFDSEVLTPQACSVSNPDECESCQ